MQKLTNSYIYTEWIEKNIILFLAVICLFFHADAHHRLVGIWCME
jgi:hypothetical protein